jgi:cell division septum initiation protein DivIVA
LSGIAYPEALVPIRPEELTISGLPRAPFGAVKADAVADLLKRVAWDYRAVLAENKKLSEQVGELALVREALELQVQMLEKAAAEHKDPEELGKALLGSAQRAAREQREAARRDGELLLKKVHGRAQEIEDEAQKLAATGLAELAKLDELRHHVVSELRDVLQAMIALWHDERASEPAPGQDHVPAQRLPLTR